MPYVNYISINLEEKVHETKTVCNSKHRVNLNTQLPTQCPPSLMSSLTSPCVTLPLILFSQAHRDPWTQQAPTCLGTFAHVVLSARSTLSPKTYRAPPLPLTCSWLCSKVTLAEFPNAVTNLCPRTPSTPNPLSLGWDRTGRRGAGVVTEVGQWVSDYRKISRAWQDIPDNIKFFVIKFWKGSFWFFLECLAGEEFGHLSSFMLLNDLWSWTSINPLRITSDKI